MLKKPAVLLVEKAGGKVETIAGELGEIYSAARELRNETNDSGNPDSILRIMALSGRGVRAEYKFKGAIRSQPVESETVIDNGEGGEHQPQQYEVAFGGIRHGAEYFPTNP